MWKCNPTLAHGMPFQMRISSLVSFPFLPAQLARVISILFQETRSMTLHVTRPKIKTWNIHSKNWVAILYPFCSGFHLWYHYIIFFRRTRPFDQRNMFICSLIHETPFDISIVEMLYQHPHSKCTNLCEGQGKGLPEPRNTKEKIPRNCRF